MKPKLLACIQCGTPLTGRQRQCCGKRSCVLQIAREGSRVWWETVERERRLAKYATSGREYSRRYYQTVARERYKDWWWTGGGREAWELRHYGAEGKPTTYTCKGCGKVGQLRRGDYRRTTGDAFCSVDCQKHYHRGIHSPLRRARERGVVIEQFSRKDIFERDGWRCGICGKAIRRGLKHPHPLSASLDHIIPLAVGGSHTKANVQATHLRCNIVKKAKDGGQLRLAG